MGVMFNRLQWFVPELVTA